MKEEDVLQRILDKVEDPTNLSLALLQKITGNFSEVRKIGQGAFGEVYKGVLGERFVAVKRIYINETTVDDKLFRREFISLWKTNHQNIVRFLGFCSNTYQKMIEDVGSGETILASVFERLLCFEYIRNGSLDKHITDELRGLEWETRYEIITGICKGLRYLHQEKNIIHMDLKPANILLDHQNQKYMVPKIADFGMSRSNKKSHTVGQRYGTLGYWAPEYRDDSKTTPACDIYSLGVIITELVTGCKDVPNKDNVLRRWRHRWSKPPTLLQYQQVTRCIEIAVRCREQKTEARPSLLEIISLLSDYESMDEHTGQISDCFHDDDMLGIKPLELQLPSDLKEILWSIELTNGTRNHIAFNIHPPSRQRYTILPDKGIVRPKSQFGVKIIVQTRDVHKQDHANKFTVQSMKASEDLTDEDITERMFEESCKVVDEVDIIVVYEPTKPHENSKSREETNVPAEKILKDINSNRRGQCVELTDRCTLRSPQSFSRHYPTNRKYLGRESERAVDLARGAMGSLLDKLGKLVMEDHNLEKSIKSDIESFSEGLMIIHQDLPKLKNVDGSKIWVEEVRELSYHIEDMVDSFLVHVEPDSNRSGFRELTHDGLYLLVNGMPTHHQIDDVIRDIKNLVQAVADRKEKYNFDVTNVIAYANTKTNIDELRNLAIYEDKEELIGIEKPRNELIRLFEQDGDILEQNLKIVSIVGLGGLGKTTLAKAVYEKLQAHYHTRAFVPVGRNPDVKKVLKNIISELEKDFNAKNLDVRELIQKINELLKNRRYFIIIDDVWDASAWDLIKYAFPRNKHGSRVITTTRIHHVALACCNSERKFVYRIKGLNEEESKILFFRRIFGSKGACPDALKDISIHILKRCCGMPLAINSIASLLAGEPESTWEYVWKSLGALTEGNNGLENMTQILDLSYINLPDDLKTCLLYVCKYPEDREIDKNDLLRQWVAEDFVRRKGRLEAEDVAENNFKALINMCMIEPGKTDYNNEVLSCKVHDLILDLIRSKSTEVDFIHVIDGSKDEIGACGKICRVSVQYNDKLDSTSLATSKGSLKHVRSVLLYQGSLLPCFIEFKYVRVLHLEYETYSRDLVDLTGISRLFLLRYLKIASPGSELKMPDQIGELQQLETIDLDVGELRNYPPDIVSLPWLSHLSYVGFDGGVVLPDGIDKLKSLRTLGGVSVYNSSVETIKGLGELTKLRKLEISSSLNGQTDEEIGLRMNSLHSSISRLSRNLRILTFTEESCIYTQHVQGWNGTLFPPGSHIRKLDLRRCNFQRCPEWIGQLHDLCSLSIWVTEVAGGVSIVAGLRSLAYFRLDSDDELKQGSVVISGSGAFQALKHLHFYCKNVPLSFEDGALPKLEKLEIRLLYHRARRFLPSGIEHLPAATLKEISLSVAYNDDMKLSVGADIGCKDWDENEWKVYFCSYEYYDDKRHHKVAMKALMKRAFATHHPEADIKILFEAASDGYLYDEEDYETEDEAGAFTIHEDVKRETAPPASLFRRYWGRGTTPLQSSPRLDFSLPLPIAVVAPPYYLRLWGGALLFVALVAVLLSWWVEIKSLEFGGRGGDPGYGG